MTEQSRYTEKWLICDTTGFDPAIAVISCQDCGAIVVDREVHDVFHNGLDVCWEKASTARRLSSGFERIG